MNVKKLKSAETAFLNKYPGGFEHPVMQDIAKKHRIDKLTARAEKVFSKQGFNNTELMAEEIIKTVTSSSMVSVFEKPKFRDFMRGISAQERARLVSYYYQLLHGNMQQGFENILNYLVPEKLAKWTLITVCPFYFKPDHEIFIKPTTAKGVIDYFEIENLKYQARPSWDFYSKYRDIILTMKNKVNPLLAPDNAAFSGFLMLVMEGL